MRDRMGARYRGPFASPAQRARHRRTRVPRGCRASQPGAGARRAGPCSPALRGVAPPGEPPSRRPQRADPRPRDVHRDGNGGFRGADSPRTAGRRRDRTPAHRRCSRSAHGPGSTHRAARPRRPVEPGDRRPALHKCPDRRVAPAQDIHQARRRLPAAAADGHGRSRSGGFTGLACQVRLLAPGGGRVLAGTRAPGHWPDSRCSRRRGGGVVVCVQPTSVGSR